MIPIEIIKQSIKSKTRKLKNSWTFSMTEEEWETNLRERYPALQDPWNRGDEDQYNFIKIFINETYEEYTKVHREIIDQHGIDIETELSKVLAEAIEKELYKKADEDQKKKIDEVISKKTSGRYWKKVIWK